MYSQVFVSHSCSLLYALVEWTAADPQVYKTGKDISSGVHDGVAFHKEQYFYGKKKRRVGRLMLHHILLKVISDNASGLLYLRDFASIDVLITDNQPEEFYITPTRALLNL